MGRFDYQKSEVFSAVLVCEPKNNSNIKQPYTIQSKGKKIIIEKEKEKEILASINIEELKTTEK